MASAGLVIRVPSAAGIAARLQQVPSDAGRCPRVTKNTPDTNISLRHFLKLEDERAPTASFVRSSSAGRNNASASLHAPPTTPGKVRPSAAEVARTLMEVCWEGTLATVSADGWPLGTHVQFAVDAEGRPVLRMRPGALQSLHIAGDGRCSLHVKLELPGKQKPQCTIKGQVRTPADDLALLQLETAWQRRYGKEDDDAESPVCWIEVETVLTTADVGEEEVWVAGQDYSQAEADPLRDCAPKIVGDMNRDSWEDIRRFCSSYAGMEEEVEEARMTWVDRFGFDMRVLTRDPVEVRKVRIPFAREVKDDRDARAAITLMAQLSWERERQYVPPPMALRGTPTAF